MKLANKVEQVDWFSYPAIENGVLLNGFGRGGYYAVRALVNYGLRPLMWNNNSEVSISFCHPEWYTGGQFIKGQFKIGFTPWESTVIRPSWADRMNAMDLIWAPTPWVRDVYLANGITTPVDVALEGIDPDEHTLFHREEPEVFWFLHVGEPAVRKNAKMVLDAFLKVFRRNDRVRLLIKGMKVSSVHTKSKRVEINLAPLQVMEMDALYQKMHCLVYPSQGEGFGRIPLEAMASGMPTILTPYSGMEVFSDFGIPLEYEVGPTNDDFNLGEWAYPDFDDLCEKMKWVYENYEQVSTLAYGNAEIVRREFTYDAGISRALDRVEF